MRVRVGDDVFDSVVALHGPARSRAQRASCVIEVASRLPCRPRSWTQVADTEDLWVGRADRWTVACLDGAADLAVSHDGTRIVVRPHDDLAGAALSHLVLDVAMPLRLAVLGRTVLHATAVALDNQAVAFTAPSGAGKSTMAVAWCARGAVLVADDCLEVRRRGDGPLMVVPSYPGSRLRPDAAARLAVGSSLADGGAGKRFVGSLPHATGHVPLAAVVLVHPVGADKPAVVRRLGAIDAFEQVRRQLFFAELDRGEARDRSIAQLAELVERCEVLVADVPRDLARLDESFAAIGEAAGVVRRVAVA